jgi:uncharacterized membrane protein
LIASFPFAAPLARVITNWRVWLLIAIVAGGSARLIEPDRMLYWHDEVFTLLRVFGHDQDGFSRLLFSGELLRAGEVARFQAPDESNTWSDTLSSLAQHPEQAPLYYLLSRLTAAFTSPPAAGPRVLAALTGLLLVPAVFWLMRELWGAGRGPWIAAALVSVSPLHLLYAHEARPYALWTLLICAASAALLRALRRDRNGDWWLYGGLLLIGFYSHLLFLLLVPLHGAFTALARRGRPPPGWFAATLSAAVGFLPWVAVLVLSAEQVGHYLAWMERPLSTAELVGAWGQHLLRLFFDPGPPTPALLWALLPLAAALAYFCRRAPTPGRWLICLIAATWVGVVLGPDLLSGGTRSVHARYALPSLLAVQLALAWVLAALWQGDRASRNTAIALLWLLLPLGAWSQWRILQADTWWSKNFSASNAAVARYVNQAERPLILVSNQGVSSGELLSLAHRLDPDVAVWGEPERGAALPPSGDFATIFALTPSPQLVQRLSPSQRLVPLLGTWQWFQATPLTEGDH